MGRPPCAKTNTIQHGIVSKTIEVFTADLLLSSSCIVTLFSSSLECANALVSSPLIRFDSFSIRLSFSIVSLRQDWVVDGFHVGLKRWRPLVWDHSPLPYCPSSPRIRFDSFSIRLSLLIVSLGNRPWLTDSMSGGSDSDNSSNSFAWRCSSAASGAACKLDVLDLAGGIWLADCGGCGQLLRACGLANEQRSRIKKTETRNFTGTPRKLPTFYRWLNWKAAELLPINYGFVQNARVQCHLCHSTEKDLDRREELRLRLRLRRKQHI